MKQFYTYIAIIAILFTTSCKSIVRENNSKSYFEFNKNNESIKIVDFEKVKEIEIPYDTILKFEVKEIDSNLIIAGLARGKNKVYIYNLTQNTRKVVSFEAPHQHPWDFGYINNDSIFILYSASDNNWKHDSTFLLIDNSGRVKKSYSFEGANVETNDNSLDYVGDNGVVWVSNFYEEFNFRNDKAFLHFSSKAKYLGESAYSELPIAGYINTAENKYYPLDVSYPSIEFGSHFYNASDKRFFSILGQDDNLLFAFRYTPKIVKYDIQTKQKEQVEIKSKVFDTIYPTLSSQEIPKGFDFSMPYPKYFTIKYNKYQQLYYRFVLLPQPYNKDYRYSIIVADSAFNYVAEGVYPPASRFYFTKDYLITTNQREGNNRIISFYKMQFNEGTNQQLIARIKSNRLEKKPINKPVEHYLKNYCKIKDKNYTVTILDYDQTCTSVSQSLFLHYLQNNEKYNQYGVYLIIQTANPDFLNTHLENTGIVKSNSPNIILDSDLKYSAYNNYKVADMPRILKIRQNKILTDTIIELSDDNTKIQKYLIESGKEQKNLK